ncbi:MAG: hypothetical protein M3O03_15325 [Pseudomonadota bacterium]|nr:hypothetical protein [Pseudomonadota bacterium]
MIQALAAHPILAAAALCFLCAGLFHEAQRWLLALCIPAAEIEALAEEFIANFGQRAIVVAIDQQERAVWRSEPGEEGKWRRVASEIRRRNKHTKAG